MDDCASIVSVAEECSCMAYFATIMDVAEWLIALAV